MYCLRLIYITPRRIIIVEEKSGESEGLMDSLIIEYFPPCKVRKKLTKNTVSIFEKTFVPNVVHYVNRKRKGTELMRSAEIREHIRRSQPWRKFDRLGKPQILIYVGK